MFKLMNIFKDHPKAFSTEYFFSLYFSLVLTPVAFPFFFNSDFFLKIQGHLMAPTDQIQSVIMI